MAAMAGILTGVPQSAMTDESSEISKCAALTDDLDRLACFDQIAHSLSVGGPQSLPAPTPTKDRPSTPRQRAIDHAFGMLTAAGVLEPSVRRPMVDASLEAQGFAPLTDEEAKNLQHGTPSADRRETADPLPSVDQVLTADVLKAVIGESDGFHECFLRAENRYDLAVGRLWIELLVSPAGTPLQVQIVTDPYQGSVLEKCVAGEIEYLRFPDFAGDGPETVRFPFDVQ